MDRMGPLPSDLSLSDTLRLFSLISNKAYSYLSNRALSALQRMSPSSPLAQSTLIHICPPRDLGHFWELSTLMNWLGCPLLGLPRSFCRSKSQLMPLYITLVHITAKTTQQYSSYIKRHIFIQFYIFAGELKRTCLARVTLSGTLRSLSNFTFLRVSWRGPAGPEYLCWVHLSLYFYLPMPPHGLIQKYN